MAIFGSGRDRSVEISRDRTKALASRAPADVKMKGDSYGIGTRVTAVKGKTKLRGVRRKGKDCAQSALNCDELVTVALPKQSPHLGLISVIVYLFRTIVSLPRQLHTCIL